MVEFALVFLRREVEDKTGTQTREANLLLTAEYRKLVGRPTDW